MNTTQLWTYKGVDVFRADRNSMGLRWYCRTPNGTLRADTKARMRHFITACGIAQPAHAAATPGGGQ